MLKDLRFGTRKEIEWVETRLLYENEDAEKPTAKTLHWERSTFESMDSLVDAAKFHYGRKNIEEGMELVVREVIYRPVAVVTCKNGKVSVKKVRANGKSA